MHESEVGVVAAGNKACAEHCISTNGHLRLGLKEIGSTNCTYNEWKSSLLCQLVVLEADL